MYQALFWIQKGTTFHSPIPSHHFFQAETPELVHRIFTWSVASTRPFPDLLVSTCINTLITVIAPKGRQPLNRVWTGVGLAVSPPWLGLSTFTVGAYAHVGIPGSSPTSNVSTKTMKTVFIATATEPCLVLGY